MRDVRQQIKGSPKVIAIGNLKGGTGKSTAAVNLACAFADAGYRSLVVDTDPQKSATNWARYGNLPASVVDFPLRNLNAAGEWLSELDILKQRYARIVIDLPSVVSPALASAFLIADMILIPTSVSELDIQATRRTLVHVTHTRRERLRSAPIVMVLPTQVRKRWFGDGGVKASLPALGETLLPSMPFDRAFSHAFKTGRWIGAAAKGSAGHRAILEIMQVTEALLREKAPLAPSRPVGLLTQQAT